MADAFDLFKRLSAGATFDHKRYKKDWEKFKPVKAVKYELGGKTVSEALDFFGDCYEGSDKKRENKDRGRTKRRHSGVDTTQDKNDNECTLSDIQSKKKRKKKISKKKQDNDEIDDNDLTVQLFAGQSKASTKGNKTFSVEKITELHQEKVNLFRHEHHIYTKGSDIPDPLQQFTDLQKRFTFPDYLMKNIREMGYECPTAIQMQTIPIMLHKRDILGCAPTGSGKTLAFILPILYHLKSPQKSGFRAVVVSPTRELAQQIYHEFCHMSKGIPFRIHVLTKSKASSNSFGPKSSQRHDILVTTPNRLVHLLNQDPPGITLKNVELLVLDEADKLFEEGKDGFREQVAAIYQACDKPNIQHALFSATLSNGIEDWSRMHLDNCVRVTVGVRNSATETVEQELLFVGQEAGKLLAVRDIVQKGFKPPVLIFVQSKERAKELFHELIYDGISVDVIHSERTQAQRDNIVKCFRTGKIWVLIATELMSRGIDFKGVNLVVNYDFPSSSVAYIHRIGRTGRAGRPGKAITFFTEDDVVNLRSIANVMRNSGCEIPDWMLKVKKPDRKTQKRLTKVPVQRKTIKTASKYDIQRSKRKRQIIEGSKKKKKAKTEDNTD